MRRRALAQQEPAESYESESSSELPEPSLAARATLAAMAKLQVFRDHVTSSLPARRPTMALQTTMRIQLVISRQLRRVVGPADVIPSAPTKPIANKRRQSIAIDLLGPLLSFLLALAGAYLQTMTDAAPSLTGFVKPLPGMNRPLRQRDPLKELAGTPRTSSIWRGMW
jgi:hypothetical protein